MTRTLPKAIVLTGGPNPELSVRFANIIAVNPVEMVAVVASPRCDPILAENIRGIFGGNTEIIYARKPGQDRNVQNLLDQGVDFAFNAGFDYIIDKEFLRRLKAGAVNAHPTALPLNRGSHFAFWGIMDKTMHGATIHWMNEDIDCGDIIDQEVFEDDGFMTAANVMEKAEALCCELWKKNIPRILDATAPRRPQGEGSHHFKKEITEASTLHCGDTVTVDRLFDLCRATACKGNGFHIVKGNRRMLVRTTIEDVTGNYIDESDE